MTEKPNQQPTILCLSSYEKGDDFLRECKRQGCHVVLVTVKKLGESSYWPREAIDEIYMLPSDELNTQPDITYAISYLARTRKFASIVALDEFDIEIAASLREHLRIPGMGETTARRFRDKLAMRIEARELGIRVPEFSGVINYDDLKEFIERISPPWVLKPRLSASAIGIKKIHSGEELWRTLDELGDEQSFRVLEKYIPGEIFHVDSIIWDGEVVFAAAHGYGQPPLNVMHEGGIFTTHSLLRGSDDEQALQQLNRQLLKSFRLVRGVAHSEFIKGEDGKFYFLETAARVGGAYISEVVKAATGIDLWSEWACVEVAHIKQQPYSLPPLKNDYAGIVLSLAKQEEPDTSAYTESEIVFRVHKKHHVGLVVASPSVERVQSLIANYTERFYQDFHASVPPPDKPTA
ncbi:MAG TPA: ATP-grasp domain-containing protein [Blastocatellia bacterium]|nr:ATP-grasp domain-containing protein [Blastocatellia bacterium]